MVGIHDGVVLCGCVWVMLGYCGILGLESWWTYCIVVGGVECVACRIVWLSDGYVLGFGAVLLLPWIIRYTEMGVRILYCMISDVASRTHCALYGGLESDNMFI